jgi:hypothetical protein
MNTAISTTVSGCIRCASPHKVCDIREPCGGNRCRTDRGSVALDQTAEYVAGQCLDRDGYAKLAQQRRVRSLDGMRRTSCEAIQHVGTA